VIAGACPCYPASAPAGGVGGPAVAEAS
jgi:hypothetical protein